MFPWLLYFYSSILLLFCISVALQLYVSMVLWLYQLLLYGSAVLGLRLHGSVVPEFRSSIFTRSYGSIVLQVRSARVLPFCGPSTLIWLHNSIVLPSYRSIVPWFFGPLSSEFYSAIVLSAYSPTVP